MTRFIFFICLLVFLAAVLSAQEPPTPPPPPAPPAPVPAIEVKEITPFTYYAVEMTGTYDQHAQAFQKLYEETYKQGMSAYADPMAIYYNDPANTPVEQLKWEVGFPLEETKEIAAPLVVKKWEFATVAARMYEGAFDQQLAAAYAEVYQWIGGNGYTPVGPMMEKYLDMPQQNENGLWIGKMEILVPVQKAQ